MPDNPDNLKKVVSEEEEIENLAGNLRKNGLAGSISESVELAKRIIARQHMMYGYISAKKPEMQKEANPDERFKTPAYNIAEEEGTTLKDLMKESDDNSGQGLSYMPTKAEPLKPGETVFNAPQAEKKSDGQNIAAPEASSEEKKPDEKKEDKSTSEAQESKE